MNDSTRFARARRTVRTAGILLSLLVSICAVYCSWHGVPGADQLALAGALTILPPALRNTRKRQLLTVAPTVFPSTTNTPIPRDFVYDAFKLAVRSQVDVAAGAGADGALAPEQPYSLIREIRIIGGSSSRANVAEIRKIDPAALRVLTGYLQHSMPLNAPLAIPGIQAATLINWNLEIPFYLPRSERPGACALNTHELQSLDLQIDWGAGQTDLNIGGTRVWTDSAAIAQLNGIERLEVDANQTRFAVNMTRYMEFTGVTANGRFPVEIRGARILRGLLIKSFTRAAGVIPHTPVDTIINSVTLEVNGTPKLEWRTNGLASSGWLGLQRDNEELYQVAHVAGYGFVDLMRDGSLATLIRESDFSTLQLVLDVNTVANGCIRVYPVEILDIAQ